MFKCVNASLRAKAVRPVLLGRPAGGSETYWQGTVIVRPALGTNFLQSSGLVEISAFMGAAAGTGAIATFSAFGAAFDASSLVEESDR